MKKPVSKEESKPAPQLTFTEDEVKKLTDYFNLVANKAVLSLRPQEVVQFQKAQAFFVQHLKKVEAHIFEVKRHWKAKDKK